MLLGFKKAIFTLTLLSLRIAKYWLEYVRRASTSLDVPPSIEVIYLMRSDISTSSGDAAAAAAVSQRKSSVFCLYVGASPAQWTSTPSVATVRHTKRHQAERSGLVQCSL